MLWIHQLLLHILQHLDWPNSLHRLLHHQSPNPSDNNCHRTSHNRILQTCQLVPLNFRIEVNFLDFLPNRLRFINLIK